MIEPDLIAHRRALHLNGYMTLAKACMDGDYVSPLQITASSPTGPVLLAYHWLDAPSVARNLPVLRQHGYLPGIPFNNVVDCALAKCEMSRADVYMTQMFHLLPPTRSYRVPLEHVDLSFKAVTLHELLGLKVIALGVEVRNACRRNGVRPDQCVDHPSARGPGRTVESKAARLADAIRATTMTNEAEFSP